MKVDRLGGQPWVFWTIVTYVVPVTGTDPRDVLPTGGIAGLKIIGTGDPAPDRRLE